MGKHFEKTIRAQAVLFALFLLQCYIWVDRMYQNCIHTLAGHDCICQSIYRDKVDLILLIDIVQIEYLTCFILPLSGCPFILKVYTRQELSGISDISQYHEELITHLQCGVTKDCVSYKQSNAILYRNLLFKTLKTLKCLKNGENNYICSYFCT